MITKFEQYNAQDMMSIPTSITKGKDPLANYITKLKPYYDYVKAEMGFDPTIKDISQITDDEIDSYIGFSFIAYYAKVYIVTDLTDVSVLINKQLIPLEGPSEIMKIIDAES